MEKTKRVRVAWLMTLFFALQIISCNQVIAVETGTDYISYQVKTELTDKQGKKVAISTLAEGATIAQLQDVKVISNYTITVEKDISADGQSVNLEVVDGLDLSAYTSPQPIRDEQGRVGEWQYNEADKKIHLKLEADIEKGTVLGMIIDGQFSLDKTSTTNQVAYIFPVSQSESKTITIKFPPQVEKEVNKIGFPIKQVNPLEIVALNADAIRWQVDFNTKLDTISQAEIIDSYDNQKLHYVPGSVKIYPLTVTLGGNTSVAEGVPEIDTAIYTIDDSETGKLKIHFEQAIERAYRLVYQTEIIDGSIKTTEEAYTNKVTFVDAASSLEPAESTASLGINRSPMIEKEGQIDRHFNPTSITWTIYLNKQGRTINQPVFKDVLPDGVIAPATLADIKMNVYKGVDDSGKVTGEAMPVTLAEEAFKVDSHNPQAFSLELGNQIDKVYKLEYTTPITDLDKLSFANEAELKGRIQAFDLTGVRAKATVTGFLRGRLLDKTSQPIIAYEEGKDNLIKWTIDINQTEQSLSAGLSLADSLPAGLVLLSDDKYPITVQPMRLAERDGQIEVIPEGIALVQGVDYSLDGTEYNQPYDSVTEPLLMLKFNNPFNQAYRITYYTQVKDRLKTSFVNQAHLTGETDSNELIDETVTANQLIDNLMVKGHSLTGDYHTGGLNYDDKTIKWRIIIDPRKEAMKSLVINDKFTQWGLNYQADSLQIREVTTGGLVDVEDTEYQFSTSQNLDDPTKEMGFQLVFKQPITKKTIIEYITFFDQTKHLNYPNGDFSEFVNQAEINWQEGSTVDSVHQKIVTDQVKAVTTPYAKNGRKHGQVIEPRQSRQIRWFVDLNYLSQTIDNFKVVDKLGNGQELIEESIEIYPYSVKANGDLVYGVDALTKDRYTISQTSDTGFTITFDGRINSPYSVQYRTKLKGKTKKEYTNQADLGKGQIVEAKVPFADSDKFISKKGVQAGWEIHWQADINKSLSEIENAKLIDELKGKQEYDSESFKLYRLTKAGYELVRPLDYTLEMTYQAGHPGFILYFDEDIEDGKSRKINSQYLLKYTTVVLSADDSTLDNSIKLEGSSTDYQNQVSEDERLNFNASVTINITRPSAKSGCLLLEKRDGETNYVLADVIFNLYKKGNQSFQLVGSRATDSQGKLEFRGLPYGDYQLKEIEPALYFAEEKAQPFAFEVSKNKLKHSVSIKNYKKRLLKIRKIDQDNLTKKLAGAVFVVQDKQGKEIARSQPTNEQGETVIEGIRFGDYRLVEIMAPNGYQRNYQPIMIQIHKEDKQQVYEYVVKNRKKVYQAEETGDSTPPKDNNEQMNPTELIKPTTPIQPTTPKKPDKPLYQGDDDVIRIEVTEPPVSGNVTITEDNQIFFKPSDKFEGEDKMVVKITHRDGRQEFVEIDIDDDEIAVGGSSKPDDLPKTGGQVTGVWALLLVAGLFLVKGKSLLNIREENARKSE